MWCFQTLLQMKSGKLTLEAVRRLAAAFCPPTEIDTIASATPLRVDRF